MNRTDTNIAFLRAHANYLMTGLKAWPFVDSARAIVEANRWAVDTIENSGLVERDRHISDLKLVLQGVVGRWLQCTDRATFHDDLEEFVERAEKVLREGKA